jgi:hypothetical protein
LIGRLLRSGASRRHLAVPTVANEVVLIISRRVNPILFLRFEFIIATRFSLSFPIQFSRGPTQLRGQIHSSLWQL